MRWLICATREDWDKLLRRIEEFRGIPNELWHSYAIAPIPTVDGFAMPIITEAMGALTDDEIGKLTMKIEVQDETY